VLRFLSDFGQLRHYGLEVWPHGGRDPVYGPHATHVGLVRSLMRRADPGPPARAAQQRGPIGSAKSQRLDSSCASGDVLCPGVSSARERSLGWQRRATGRRGRTRAFFEIVFLRHVEKLFGVGTEIGLWDPAETICLCLEQGWRSPTTRLGS
jgi:hypothetical protein